MIIGTAGHIDHGKTSLVYALTGVTTDRLKEEKERGITIELGYAYQPLQSGEVLGYIDVPGHERFIHTMLAGAAGIDFALLVVAADDGVMPQTREHLDILNLLGVAQGAVALTKTDRVTPERVEEVKAEVAALLASTALAESPVFPVSAISGQGIDELRDYLHEVAAGSSLQSAQGRFRLAVDRSFSLQGIGTVVTGTVFDGQVNVGDELLSSPGGHAVRVRSLHVQNRSAQTGRAGERCALNLAGVDKSQLTRGDWVMARELHAPTDRFDAHINLSVNAPQALKHWSPLHLHLGASHVMARVALLQEEPLAPGASALAQLVLERPIGALHGDAFILRDAEARHTLGGGQVLDPWAPPRRRKTAERLAMLEALQLKAPQQRLHTLLAAAEWGLDISALSRAWNQPELLSLLPAEAMLVDSGKQAYAFDGRRWQAYSARLLQQLATYHQGYPDELGIDAARARRMFLGKLPVPAFNELIQTLLTAGRLARSGTWLHLPEHRIQLSAAEQALSERIKPSLQESQFDPPWVRDLCKRAEADEVRMRQLMQKLARSGEVFQVVRDLFYTNQALTLLADMARALEKQHAMIRAADLRDASGIGRKRTIQLLEFFDRVGFTRRAGDAHCLRNADLFKPDNSAN
ncbi:MAG TPA: selenocysteine-specific translation elongation factor [Gallionellaceae bacterium]|nr:selenocysteine-specific translation elongation factor [Gallionellaceae bacterium]